MKQKRKLGRVMLSFMLTLAMVFGTFTGIVPGTGITAKADTSDTGVEVLIADIDDRNYKDKTTSFITDDGLANISFSVTPTFDDEYGWYNPNGELTITVTAANEDYPISKCVFQCCGEGREDNTAPFEVTISYGGNWQNTTATINNVTETSGGLRNIGFFSLVTPDYTVLKDGMLIKPGESIIPGDYYYKTAERVNTESPEEHADFKKNTLYTLVKGNIESRQVNPSYDPDWVEDVFVESNNGDHYAFLQVADGKYIFDGSWKVTNHADGLLVSQGTSESMSNPEERITTYAFSVHEKVFNDVMVDNTIENGSIEVKDSEETAISEAEAGSTVTLDVSADEGYKLKEISAKYLEVQSVSELMELMGDTKYYANPNDTEYSDYYMATADGIKCFLFYGDEKAFLSKTAELDKSKSVEGVYTAIGTYDDAPLTWIFKVKKGKIISIGFERNGVDWGIVNIESTGTIAKPTYASVELTPVTTGKQYTFTMPATDVTVNAVFEEDSAQNTWTSGDCTVTYDSDTKTMTVTGNGAMGSYESEDQVPWKDVIEESVEKIVIDEGVTSIGENVFYHCDSVKEIYISSTVRNIKNQAFYNYSMYSSNVYFTRPSVDCELQIDGMPFNLDYWTLNYSGDGKYVLYDKNIDLENASSVTKLIGNWEADGAGGSIYTTKIFTWKIPTSSITCISEHGVVTASVGGTDVTTAEVGDEVTLKVKPDLGYQLKSITATFPKDGVETFDDLVGLMGDAVINGDTKNQFGEYTCKVENGQFAIYNGNDLVSRTSDITDFEVRDNGHTIVFNSGNLGWYFGLDRDTGNIIVISVSYISDWNSAFVSADNSESTGTLPPNEVLLTTVKEGSDYKFIMPKRDVTIKTEYEKVAVVTKAPEAKTLTYNGQEQELVTAGSATGGVMQYALGTKTEDTGEYSTSIPTATAAGTYYIWYKVVGDENHLDSDVACVTSKILADISKTVTFKVVNGSWNDGEAKDKVVKLEGFEGDILKLSADKIPAVGTKPSDGYKEGSWDTVPKADIEIKADTTYTYTYAKKEEVKPEPIVEPTPVQKIKLTVTAKDQTIAFGAAISQASSKYTIKGLQTGDEAKVTLKADMKKFTITPVVTVKNGDKDVTDTYDITAVSANIAISQVPMVAAISKGKSITATLTKIKNVDGYLIYTGYCGGTSKLVKTVKGNKAVKYTYKKINGKALDRKKASKVIVKAYRLVDGKKVVVATSMTAHVAGVLNKKLANASSVTVAKKNIVLKSGKTANVDAKVVLTTTKKAQLSKGHAAEIRYASSNTAVATVDAKGKITAKGKGKCTVYAVAVDGTRATVDVTVK